MLRSIGKLFMLLFSTLFVINSVPGNVSATHSETINSVYSEYADKLDVAFSNEEQETTEKVEQTELSVIEEKIEKETADVSSNEPSTADITTTEKSNVTKNVSAKSESKAAATVANKATTTKATTTKSATTTKAATAKATTTAAKTSAQSTAKTSFSTSKSSIYINYSSDEEKWVAQNLVNANTTFSIVGYSSLYSYSHLLDVIDKVIYQNPYILGVFSEFYDEATKTVTVHYAYDTSKIKSKQNSLNSSAKKIINSIISGNMSDEQKRLAIYNYLQSNVSYDQNAANAAKAAGYSKTSDHTYEDSFNAYGALVNKKGVCMAYASAFKLLCDMAGVTCVYVTGTLKGASHMWNMVKIDGAWYHVDPTNNKNVSGIPYKVYNAPKGMASDFGYVLDKDFTLDSEFSSYKVGTSYNYEYYTKNKLVAGSFSEYKDVLKSNIKSGNHSIIVRFNASYNKNDFMNAVKAAFTELNMGSSLSSVKGSQNGKYLIVTY